MPSNYIVQNSKEKLFIFFCFSSSKEKFSFSVECFLFILLLSFLGWNIWLRRDERTEIRFRCWIGYSYATSFPLNTSMHLIEFEIVSIIILAKTLEWSLVKTNIMRILFKVMLKYTFDYCFLRYCIYYIKTLWCYDTKYVRYEIHRFNISVKIFGVKYECISKLHHSV